MNHLSITGDNANRRFRSMCRVKAYSNATMYFLANLTAAFLSIFLHYLFVIFDCLPT